MTWTADDHRCMFRALQLARNGRYTCDPNPRVGCVIAKDNRIIGEGWHAVAGEVHAEVDALGDGLDATGATVYLTLEPCNHEQRTPACTEALIRAKVATVIIAMVDPNPRVSGAGIKRLEEAGITVRQGLLEAEARRLNPGFIKRMTAGLPYVRCKMAMSVDARTALADGESRWISSEPSRRDAHQLRAASSAILTSAGTVICDDPALTVREFDEPYQAPLRVVVDRQFRIPDGAKTITLPGKVILYTENRQAAEVAAFDNADIDIVCLDNGSGLSAVLAHLAREYEVNEVLVEAGSAFTGALLTAGLVDDLIVYLAPKLLGDDAKPLCHLPAPANLADAMPLTLMDVRRFGGDLRLTYRPAAGGVGRMFAGIIEATGRIKAIIPLGEDRRYVFDTGALDLSDVAVGDSIAVNGVCLTVIEKAAAAFSADLSAETLALTTFETLEPGAAVNFERSLRLADRVNGHLVSGHVDGVGRIVERSSVGRSVCYSVALPETLQRFVVKKGAIAIDGVSLTVNDRQADECHFILIPHTLSQTIAADYEPETVVNIEIDPIARYLHSWAENGEYSIPG